MIRSAPRQSPQPILKLVTPACHDAGDAPAVAPAGQLTVALIGQPNVGKSTVFNMLTGLSQHVGNWPGKTVEQKTGTFRRQDGLSLSLVDLPGTYSLTANSEEERVARDYLIRERPDVVIAVVNAAALERNLYLVAELLAMQQPVVLGLNMLDVAEQHGIHVEPHVLEAALGIPVVPIVATKNQGVKELADAAVKMAQSPDAYTPNRPAIRPEHEPVLRAVRGIIADHTPAPYPEDWVALKLLEGDAEITAMMHAALPPEDRVRLDALLLKHEDAYLDIAGGRYEWIGRMVRGGGHAAEGGRHHRHRADRSRGDASDRRAGAPARASRRGILAHLHDRDPHRRLAVDPGVGHAGCAGNAHLELDAGMVLRADLRWSDPRRGHGVRVPADPDHLLRHPRHAGGCRLSGPRRVRHGSLHAPDGAARQVVHAALPGLRLQRAGGPRLAHHRRAPRPLADDPAGAAGAVHGAAGGARVPDPGLLRDRGRPSSRSGWWRSIWPSWRLRGSS